MCDDRGGAPCSKNAKSVLARHMIEHCLICLVSEHRHGPELLASKSMMLELRVATVCDHLSMDRPAAIFAGATYAVD